MGAKWQKLDLEVPPEFTARQRKKVADLVIDHIIERTQKGYDKDGDKFPPYSEEYTKSLDFRIAGKSKSRVDLTLSGDMLASLELLDSNRGKIRIGFERGSEENARADGNIRGSYGGSPNPKRARDFLGIEPDVFDSIIEEVAGGN